MYTVRINFSSKSRNSLCALGSIVIRKNTREKKPKPPKVFILMSPNFRQKLPCSRSTGMLDLTSRFFNTSNLGGKFEKPISIQNRPNFSIISRIAANKNVPFRKTREYCFIFVIFPLSVLFPSNRAYMQALLSRRDRSSCILPAGG